MQIRYCDLCGVTLDSTNRELCATILLEQGGKPFCLQEEMAIHQRMDACDSCFISACENINKQCKHPSQTTRNILDKLEKKNKVKKGEWFNWSWLQK